MAKKLSIRKEQIHAAYEQLYLKEGKCLKEVGEYLGCSKSQVSRQFVKYRFPARNTKEAAKNRSGLTDSDYREIYSGLYIGQNLSLELIASKVGVSPSTISNRFLDMGLPVRNQAQSMQARDIRLTSEIRHEHQQYMSGAKSVQSIAPQQGVHASTVYRRYKRIGLEIRRPPGAVLTDQDGHQICIAYDEGGSSRSIADKFGISARKAVKVIKASGRTSRTISEGILTALEQGRYVGHHARARTGYSEFFKSWTNESAWVLGLLLSDGSLHKSKSQFFCSLGSKDLDILHKVASAMQLNLAAIYVPKMDINSKRAPYYVLTISNLVILADMTKLGMHTRKASSVEFPIMKDQYVRHFMRGYIDGDGCFGMTQQRFSVSSKSQSMMMKFAECLYRLADVGIARKRSSKKAINSPCDDKLVSVYRRRMKTGIIYCIEVSGKTQLRKLCSFLYSNVSNDILMQRKKDVITEYL
jgi:AraC-like DNA-binding protein